MAELQKELIKIDRNGSKHWYGQVTCPRCGGAGGAEQWKATGWTCYECGGKGWVMDSWIERTPEYELKLEARRKAKRAKWEAEHAEEIAKREAYYKELEEKREAERKAKEAEKAISQFVGTVGEKLEMEVTYIGSPRFERPSFGGWGTETCYIHTFKDANGNKLVWKTSSAIWDIEEGQKVTVRGTVKEHNEYKGEKQTNLIRCKIK